MRQGRPENILPARVQEGLRYIGKPLYKIDERPPLREQGFSPFELPRLRFCRLDAFFPEARALQRRCDSRTLQVNDQGLFQRGDGVVERPVPDPSAGRFNGFFQTFSVVNEPTLCTTREKP